MKARSLTDKMAYLDYRQDHRAGSPLCAAAERPEYASLWPPCESNIMKINVCRLNSHRHKDSAMQMVWTIRDTKHASSVLVIGLVGMPKSGLQNGDRCEDRGRGQWSRPGPVPPDVFLRRSGPRSLSNGRRFGRDGTRTVPA